MITEKKYAIGYYQDAYPYSENEIVYNLPSGLEWV